MQVTVCLTLKIVTVNIVDYLNNYRLQVQQLIVNVQWQLTLMGGQDTRQVLVYELSA